MFRRACSQFPFENRRFGDNTLPCAVPVDSLPEGLQGEDWLRRLLELDHGKRSPDIQTFDPGNLVQQVDRGDLLAVRQLVKDHPEKVAPRHHEPVFLDNSDQVRIKLTAINAGLIHNTHL